MALRRESADLREGFTKLKENHETELSNITAESLLALKTKNAEYEQLLSEVNTLKAENDGQRSMVHFLKQNRGYWSQWLLRTETGSKISAREVAEIYVLASRSLVVQKMLSNPSQVPSFLGYATSSRAVIEELLNFCHCGDIAFSGIVPPEEVLGVAHTLDIGLLKGFCEAELCRRLSVDNVPQMLKLSRKFPVSKLQEKAEKLFKEHFDMLKSKVYDVLEGSGDYSKEFDDIPEGANEIILAPHSGPETRQNKH